MKKLICDICGKEVDQVNNTEIPVKVSKSSMISYTVDEEDIDICNECKYELDLQSTLSTIRLIKKMKKNSKKVQ